MSPFKQIIISLNILLFTVIYIEAFDKTQSRQIYVESLEGSDYEKVN